MTAGHKEVASRPAGGQPQAVMRWSPWWGVGCLVLTGAACSPSRGSRPAVDGRTNAEPVAVRVDPREPTRAQPRLRTVKLWLGTNELTSELAVTMEEIMTGMMFRTNLGETEGMLFVFGRPHRAGFWMKNVTVPLSCAYLDPEGVILEIHDMEPGNTNPITAGSDRIQYVLETPQGWFDRHRVATGTLARTELGSLPETFWRRSRAPAAAP